MTNSLSCLGLPFFVVLLAPAAQGQVLHDVTAECEVRTLVTYSCLPPAEDRRVSPAVFTRLDENNCGGDHNCATWTNHCAAQQAAVFADSIDVYEEVYANILDMHPSSAPSVLSTSDAVFHFKVDPGHRYSYDVEGGLYTETPHHAAVGGSAIAWYKFTRQGSGEPRVLYSKRVESGPQQQLPNSIGLGAIAPDLREGDYTIEVHVSASAFGADNTTIAHAVMTLKLRDITTPIAPMTWGRTKTLYK